MKSAGANVVTALGLVAMAAIGGGALTVFAEAVPGAHFILKRAVRR